MGNSSAGPLTLILAGAIVAAVAVLAGWLAGRANRGVGLGIGALVFIILSAGGAWLIDARPAIEGEAAPAPAASPSPFITSAQAGGKHEAVRKAPSVGAQDIMMLWTVDAADRERVCVREMKHFAQDCRDAVAGMAEMTRPGIPDTLFARLAGAVKADLANRDTSDLADQAIAATRASRPDEIYAFPSPGGTNANVYWCAGGDDRAHYDAANKAALALARIAGLKLAQNVVVGRVLLIRLDPARQGVKVPKLGDGDLIFADPTAPATAKILDQLRTSGHMIPMPHGPAPGPESVAIYACR